MSNNTIFDDVFRTMLQKMPQMAILLINEVFGKDYPENIKLKQGRNEFYTKDGKVITDSHFQIEEKIYHLECQSTKDATMMFRMIEYDFAVALESVGQENETSRIYFLHSCVLYLRDTQGPEEMKLELLMPDGQSVEYKVPVIYQQRYTKEIIFQKRLFFLLPFYIMRYEKAKKELEKNQEKLQEMLEEYRSIEKCLEEEFLYHDREKEYRDMVELIIRIADYILRDSQKVRKGFGKVMGGKVLELESDKLIKKGIELERENTEKERQRADAAEAEVKRLKLLLQEKQ